MQLGSSSRAVLKNKQNVCAAASSAPINPLLMTPVRGHAAVAQRHLAPGAAAAAPRTGNLRKSVVSRFRENEEPTSTAREPLRTGPSTGDVVPVLFRLAQRCAFGQAWGVCGSLEELGAWDPARAITMKWTEGDEWFAMVHLPEGSTAEFKFVLLDAKGGNKFISWANQLSGDNNLRFDVTIGAKMHAANTSAVVAAETFAPEMARYFAASSPSTPTPTPTDTATAASVTIGAHRSTTPTPFRPHTDGPASHDMVSPAPNAPVPPSAAMTPSDTPTPPTTTTSPTPLVTGLSASLGAVNFDTLNIGAVTPSSPSSTPAPTNLGSGSAPAHAAPPASATGSTSTSRPMVPAGINSRVPDYDPADPANEGVTLPEHLLDQAIAAHITGDSATTARLIREREAALAGGCGDAPMSATAGATASTPTATAATATRAAAGPTINEPTDTTPTGGVVPASTAVPGAGMGDDERHSSDTTSMTTSFTAAPTAAGYTGHGPEHTGGTSGGAADTAAHAPGVIGTTSVPTGTTSVTESLSGLRTHAPNTTTTSAAHGDPHTTSAADAGLDIPVSTEAATTATIMSNIGGGDEEIPMAPLSAGSTPITGASAASGASGLHPKSNPVVMATRVFLSKAVGKVSDFVGFTSPSPSASSLAPAAPVSAVPEDREAGVEAGNVAGGSSEPPQHPDLPISFMNPNLGGAFPHPGVSGISGAEASATPTSSPVTRGTSGGDDVGDAPESGTVRTPFVPSPPERAAQQAEVSPHIHSDPSSDQEIGEAPESGTIRH